MEQEKDKVTKETSDTQTLAGHLEALRGTLLRMLAALALAYVPCYFASELVIDWLIRWSLPETMGGMHFFSPMEVFLVRLKTAFVLALAVTYPWNLLQFWRFCRPAMYEHERRALRWWVLFASALFFGGVAFCAVGILPLVMRFAASFATEQMRPLLGVAGYIELTGWLSLAFGLMFQAPVLVVLAVRLGFLSCERMRAFRPYIIVGIFLLAALLTPPDIVSQIVLGVPTWLLFELGLWLAERTTPAEESRK